MLNKLKINPSTDFVFTLQCLNWAICSLNTYQNVIRAEYMLVLFLGLVLVQMEFRFAINFVCCGKDNIV